MSRRYPFSPSSWLPPGCNSVDDAISLLEYLKRREEEKPKKDEKKGKTFTYLELVSWLIIASPIVGALELAIIKVAGMVLVKTLQ